MGPFGWAFRATSRVAADRRWRENGRWRFMSIRCSRTELCIPRANGETNLTIYGRAVGKLELFREQHLKPAAGLPTVLDDFQVAWF